MVKKRARPWVSGDATTISVLTRGRLRVTFHNGDKPQVVTLAAEGDYVVFAPDTAHSWESIGDTVERTVRVPSVETRQ